MYEVVPLRMDDFMAIVRPDEYAMFRRFDAMPITCMHYI